MHTTTRRATIPSLDGIRALSIGIVFLGHAAITGFISGTTGVTIFFFLSGYLITTLLRIERSDRGSVSLRAFYLRRALRIFPPLYAAVLIALVLALTGVLDANLKAWPVISQSAFFSNYWIVAAGRGGLLPAMNQLWSLAVEEHFYLLFPLLYLGLRRWTDSGRRQAWVLLAVCAAVSVWRCALVYTGHAAFDRAYLSTDTRADSLLFGCALALGWNPMTDERPFGFERHRWRLYVAPVCAVGFFLVCMSGNGRFAISGKYTAQGLLLMPLFVSAILDPEWWPWRVFNWRPVRFLGVLSYSIYLVHRMALEIFVQHTSLSAVPRAVIAGALSVAVAYAFYRLIERPAGRLRSRLSRTALRGPAEADPGPAAHGEAQPSNRRPQPASAPPST